MEKISPLLRFWLVVHFAVDIFFAIPLFIMPAKFLELFGIYHASTTSTVSEHILGAALLAIGITSFMANQKDRDAILVVLNLNIVWAIAGATVILVALLMGGSALGWIIFLIFAAFGGVWIYHRNQLGK